MQKTLCADWRESLLLTTAVVNRMDSRRLKASKQCSPPQEEKGAKWLVLPFTIWTSVFRSSSSLAICHFTLLSQVWMFRKHDTPLSRRRISHKDHALFHFLSCFFCLSWSTFACSSIEVFWEDENWTFLLVAVILEESLFFFAFSFWLIYKEIWENIIENITKTVLPSKCSILILLD